VVFFRRVGEDQDVIEIDRDNTFGDQVLEYLVHHSLEGGQTLDEAEVHLLWNITA
jgi:hypothetical protein